MQRKANKTYTENQTPDVQKMIRAIRRTLSLDELSDVASHGADTGWPGFTYYTDTVKFYNRHETAIWQLMAEDADSMGYASVPELIATFNRAGDADDPVGFKNLCVWYALETIARGLTDGE